MNFYRVIINSAKKALKGEEKLWIVFWLWGVALLVVLRFIYDHSVLVAYGTIFRSLPAEYFNIALAVDMFFSTMFRVFLVLIVWKCAPNSKRRVWFYAARIYIVIFALATIYGRISGINYAYVKYHEFKTLTSGGVHG